MTIKLTESQNIVATDTHRFRVLCNGRRWGKTFLAIEEMKGKLLSREARVCYIGPTYQQARDNCWERLVKELDPATISVNESRLEIKVHNAVGSESICILRGWESIETLRGQYFDFIVIDEVASMKNFWESWNNVVSPTLTDKKGEVLFISTPKGFNHFYQLFNKETGVGWETGPDPDFKSFRFTSYENPNVPAEEIDRQKATLPADAFAQEYMGDFRKRTGLVYPEFDVTKHVYTERSGVTIMKLLGEDFGYTNPTALIMVEKDGDENYWVSSEWYRTGKTNTEVTEYVKTLGANKVYPDPAEPDRIEEQRRMGVNVQEVSKDVEKGIDSVREMLKAGTLHIHQSCTTLISEFETYAYEERKAGRNEPERPIKENDHGCFIAGTMTEYGKIEDVGVQTGVEDVYEYQVADEKITATRNHPIYTQRGLVDIDTLRYDDVIWKNKQLFMRVSGGTDIQAVRIGLNSIISVAARRILEARNRDYIDSSGKKQTEISLMDSIYIMLMAIPSIILWTISGLWTAVNTLVHIGLKRSASGLGRMCAPLLKLLPNGQRLRMVNGCENKWGNEMLTSCMIDRSSHENVICAENHIPQKGMGAIDSAILTAVKKHYVGHVPVYNLKTKSGMYFANGILVSNCDALRYVLHNTASHQKQRAVTFVPHRNIVGRAELARTKSFAQNYSPRMPRQ